MLSIDLTGKRAFVAGVADDKGYGWAIVRALTRAGATVCVDMPNYPATRFRAWPTNSVRISGERVWISSSILWQMDLKSKTNC
jgi:enoyl-[acyl-carrier-protein] reductase (NADH)